jgi:hypothetical protein
LQWIAVEQEVKKVTIGLLAAAAVVLSGCAVYVPPPTGVVVVPQGGPQGGPGNGFCPPGQAKKGNC